jgi:hypothetical protein
LKILKVGNGKSGSETGEEKMERGKEKAARRRSIKCPPNPYCPARI